MKRTLYTFFLPIFIFLSCERGPGLTPITQEGKNTFSCKINGKVWIPDGRSSLAVTVKPIVGGFYYDYVSHENFGTIQINTHHKSGDDLSIYLKTNYVGLHHLNENTDFKDFSPENYGFFFFAQRDAYITSEQNTGSVLITKADTLTGIISGTFEFTAGNSKGETVRITDGRFDIKSPL